MAGHPGHPGHPGNPSPRHPRHVLYGFRPDYSVQERIGHCFVDGRFAELSDLPCGLPVRAPVDYRTGVPIG
jgi:hypothetical protein